MRRVALYHGRRTDTRECSLVGELSTPCLPVADETFLDCWMNYVRATM
jgi:hypothetical protein